MKACSIPCPSEAITSGAPSPGPVGQCERVCRAAKEPMHYKKNGSLKGSVIQNRELDDGSLSVWRIDIFDDFKVESVVSEIQLKLGQGEFVKEVFAVSASSVRAILREGAIRAFCVIDDTTTDTNGGKHRAHAAIGLCAKQKESGFGKDHEEFHGVKERLLAELKKGRVWVRPVV